MISSSISFSNKRPSIGYSSFSYEPIEELLFLFFLTVGRPFFCLFFRPTVWKRKGKGNAFRTSGFSLLNVWALINSWRAQTFIKENLYERETASVFFSNCWLHKSCHWTWPTVRRKRNGCCLSFSCTVILRTFILVIFKMISCRRTRMMFREDVQRRSLEERARLQFIGHWSWREETRSIDHERDNRWLLLLQERKRFQACSRCSCRNACLDNTWHLSFAAKCCKRFHGCKRETVVEEELRQGLIHLSL